VAARNAIARFSPLIRGEKCHNYFTNKWVVEVAIELTNWNLRNLDYIAPEIVQTYDLERRKRGGKKMTRLTET
jgi:hypothetical protein